MIVVTDFPQGSPEWFAARAGVLSASCLDQLVTSTGEPSKQARKLALTLAGERVIEAKADTYQSTAMLRGIEVEAEAREFYSLITGQDVAEVGLVYQDETRRVCCSPDGLVGAGGLEIKCPALHTAVDYLLRDRLPVEYVQQVQGSMWITGAPWWDFLSYFPGLPPLLIRVERDEQFIQKLAEQVERFLGDLDEIAARIIGRSS